jgi:hypothetical protein
MSSKLAPDGKSYWFPARRYGWGWGLPLTWQGWIVLTLFFVLFAVGIFVFPPDAALGSFVIYMLFPSLAFIAICLVKGEPPRWRWGDKE